jgi:ribonuclease R
VNITKGRTPQKGEEFEGIISVTRRGVGYVPHESLEEDLEIDKSQLNCALNGDTVLVRTKGAYRGRVQGEVVKVITRAEGSFVGTLIEEAGFLSLHPDNQRMYVHIRIPEAARTEEAKPGYKALVKMEPWTHAALPPMGTIERILGKAGEHETEMQATLAAHGFIPAFPADTEREADEIAARGAVLPEDIVKRRDFRSIPTFTIDPDDAKDFDDALSFIEIDADTVEIGVHIADVTHYVRPGTALDREARNRATSVYLVDRTIPMLPDALSTDICSLVPHQERLTFSAVFTMRKSDGHITERWFGRTIINSAHRFTYRTAQDVLDAGTGDYAMELKEMSRLGLILRKSRTAAGAISFDTDEVKFELDPKGVPIRVYVKERLETMKMIEDWMLLANKEVAEFISRKAEGKNPMDTTFIYRIHDVPDGDRIEELRIFLRAVGYDLGKGGETISGRDINALLAKAKGTPEEAVIQMATLRSMAKAVYSHKNIGHFSLGFKHYTHFTSPIRRYPDMMAHRILASHLDNSPISKQELDSYRAAAIRSSMREVEAVSAERDSTKFKQVEYMAGHVGETFEGTITGVTEHGMFVAERQSRAEGMIRLSTLSDDYYDLDRKHYTLIGRAGKKKYRLGDSVKIKLLAVDLESRQLDWTLA